MKGCLNVTARIVGWVLGFIIVGMLIRQCRADSITEEIQQALPAYNATLPICILSPQGYKVCVNHEELSGRNLIVRGSFPDITKDMILLPPAAERRASTLKANCSLHFVKVLLQDRFTITDTYNWGDGSFAYSVTFDANDCAAYW